MNKYKLTIMRTIRDCGTVIIEADSPEEAEEKYFRPKQNEHVIFDDEIEWDNMSYAYDVFDIKSV